MPILVGEPFNGLFPWRTEDGKFSGAIMGPFTLTSQDAEIEDFPMGALLAVPKHSRNEAPSINKYSPLIAQAPSPEELNRKIEEWVKKNQGKRPWNLRRD